MIMQKLLLQFLLIGIFTTSALPGFAGNRLQIDVQYVSDGDTLKAIIKPSGKAEWVRLAQIDAPEKNQPFGLESKAMLKNLLDCPSPLQLENIGRDKYDRIIGEIYCGGQSINAEMVQIGGAWVYTQYATDQTLADNENQARSEKLGLWAGTKPTAPWLWRKHNN